MRVQPAVWSRLFYIGLPVGLEFFLMSIVMAVIYWIIRDFGAAAQAGFGVGQGVMRIIMLPAMAVAFASAPIAGQNFGARKPDRVRETFRVAVLYSVIIMLLETVLCQFESDFFIHIFTTEAAVVAVGVQMLVISSWNFAANGVIFCCSSMFQALGNTWPTIARARCARHLHRAGAVAIYPPGFELVTSGTCRWRACSSRRSDLLPAAAAGVPQKLANLAPAADAACRRRSTPLHESGPDLRAVAQRLRQHAEQLFDVFGFDDERGRQRDDVAGGADQQPALETLEVHAESARAGRAGDRLQLDAGHQPVVADVDDMRQSAQLVHRFLERRAPSAWRA